MTKILFINPPQDRTGNLVNKNQLEWIPLGLCYLSAIAKQQGYETKVIDLARSTWTEVEQVLKTENPDILGLSCWSDIRFSTIRTSDIARRLNKNVKIIIGGSHASFFPEHMFKLTSVDVVVIGEGEQTLKELLIAYKSNKPVTKIQGIAYKKNNKIIITKPRKLIDNLDQIPFPVYDGLDLSKYRGDDKFSIKNGVINGMMISSRGCPYQCTFCSTCLYWKRKWRARSPINTVNEMEELYNKYQVTNIRFWDDHFTLNQSRAIQICKEIIKRGLHKKLSWSTSLRVDCLNDRTIKWMKKAGCNKLIFGVESGSETILANIKKGFKVKHIKKAFKLCHKYGVYANASIMVGNKGENNQTIQETIQVLNEIKPDNLIRGGSVLIVFPNTEIYQEMKQAGKITDEYWLSDNSMPYYTLENNLEKNILLGNKLTFGLMTRKEKVRYILTKGLCILFTNPKKMFKLIKYYITRKVSRSC
jgi:radical SAM superfamily enzyme YgiQ (UPF0313 family)